MSPIRSVLLNAARLLADHLDALDRASAARLGQMDELTDRVGRMASRIDQRLDRFADRLNALEGADLAPWQREALARLDAIERRLDELQETADTCRDERADRLT